MRIHSHVTNKKTHYMKHPILIIPLLFLTLGITTYAQEKKTVVVKEVPSHTYYDNEKQELVTIPIKTLLNNWVQTHFEYPPISYKKDEQGTATVHFYITTKGELVIKEVKGDYPRLNKAAKKIFDNFPTLVPAKDENGNPVEVHFSYPINFKL